MPWKVGFHFKENENILKESETHLLVKKFRSHMIGIEKSRKKSLKVFKDVGKKSPFWKCLSHSHSQDKLLHGAGRCYYAEKPGIKTNSLHHKPVSTVTSKKRRSSRSGLSKIEDLPEQEDKKSKSKSIKSEAVSLSRNQIWITKKKSLQNLHSKHACDSRFPPWCVPHWVKFRIFSSLI